MTRRSLPDFSTFCEREHTINLTILCIPYESHVTNSANGVKGFSGNMEVVSDIIYCKNNC